MTTPRFEAAADEPNEEAVDDCLRALTGPCACELNACAAHRTWWDFRRDARSNGSACAALPARAWRDFAEVNFEEVLKVSVHTL